MSGGLVHEAPYQGATNEWYTPAWVFDALGMRFDLDPCSPAGGLHWVPADNHYALPQDGLALPWFGRVWCNPPYGPHTGEWLKACAGHGCAIALVFARTDTRWFHDYATTADAILFMDRRIKFVDASGDPPMVLDKRTGKMRESSPGAGSMLLAWGAEEARALLRSDLGVVVREVAP